MIEQLKEAMENAASNGYPFDNNSLVEIAADVMYLAPGFDDDQYTAEQIIDGLRELGYGLPGE